MRSSSDQDQITQTLLKQHVHAQERGIKSGSIMIDNTGERLEIDRKGESYACANTELSQGSKKSHYIWYVLPQLSGLGSSVTNQIFSLNSKQALAYLQDDVLRRKYISTLTLIFNSKVSSLSDLFGDDASKVASSLTLFEIIAKSDDVTSQYRAECNQIVRLISQIKKKYPFTECELTTAMLSSARGEVRSVAARLQNTRGAADSSSSSSNILLIEGGRQEVVYANQSNYYTSKTIVDNQHDTIFVLGANESHVYGRNTGGAGQAKATAGNFNILPIVTTQYNKQIPDADILRSGGYHERIAEIAKTFIRNGGKIAWPLRSATREDAELLGITFGKPAINIGTGIASGDYKIAGRKFGQELFEKCQEIGPISQGLDPRAAMQQYHESMNDLAVYFGKKWKKVACLPPPPHAAPQPAAPRVAPPSAPRAAALPSAPRPSASREAPRPSASPAAPRAAAPPSASHAVPPLQTRVSSVTDSYTHVRTDNKGVLWRKGTDTSSAIRTNEKGKWSDANIINAMSASLSCAIEITNAMLKSEGKDIALLLDREFVTNVIKFAQAYNGVSHARNKEDAGKSAIELWIEFMPDGQGNDEYGFTIAKQLSSKYQNAMKDENIFTGREENLKDGPLVGARLKRIPEGKVEILVDEALGPNVAAQGLGRY